MVAKTGGGNWSRVGGCCKNRHSEAARSRMPRTLRVEFEGHSYKWFTVEEMSEVHGESLTEMLVGALVQYFHVPADCQVLSDSEGPVTSMSDLRRTLSGMAPRLWLFDARTMSMELRLQCEQRIDSLGIELDPPKTLSPSSPSRSVSTSSQRASLLPWVVAWRRKPSPGFSPRVSGDAGQRALLPGEFQRGGGLDQAPLPSAPTSALDRDCQGSDVPHLGPVPQLHGSPLRMAPASSTDRSYFPPAVPRGADIAPVIPAQLAAMLSREPGGGSRPELRVPVGPAVDPCTTALSARGRSPVMTPDDAAPVLGSSAGSPSSATVAELQYHLGNLAFGRSPTYGDQAAPPLAAQPRTPEQRLIGVGGIPDGWSGQLECNRPVRDARQAHRHQPPTEMRRTIEVLLTKSEGPGEFFGFTNVPEVAPDGSRCLRITQVHPSGLLAEWNNRFLSHSLGIGDRIVSVNGVTDDLAQMRELLCGTSVQLVAEKLDDNVAALVSLDGEPATSSTP